MRLEMMLIREIRGEDCSSMVGREEAKKQNE